MALSEQKSVIYGSTLAIPGKKTEEPSDVENVEKAENESIEKNNDLRLRRVVINMRHEEYDHVKTSAKRRGRSMSTYIREALLEKSELVDRQYETQDNISEKAVARSLESEKICALKLLETERRCASKLLDAEMLGAQKQAEHEIELTKLQIKILEKDRQLSLYKESYKTTLPIIRATHTCAVETPLEPNPEGPSAQLLRSKGGSNG